MAEEQKTMNGVLGRLPPWPRKPASNSMISAEQAYRQRSGLPLLTEEEIAALKAGEPMPWERGDGAPAPASAAPATTSPAEPAPPAASAPAPPAPTPASTAAAAAPGMTETVKQLLASYPKWSKSAVAAEQARRKRTGQTVLTDAEVSALLGEAPAPSAAPAAAASAAAPAAASAAPRPAAAAPPVPAGPAARREGTAVRYVGTPAVGTSQAAAAAGLASTGPRNTEVDQRRRRLVWSAVAAFLGAWLIAFFRFFLPRTLFEPSTVFKIGTTADYGLGIDEKWLQKYRIWVDRTPDRLFVIYARCTHLGCTPDWKSAENKFKCPCHGSGYDNEGVNFEGPAPRPMDRAHIEEGPDGQIQVNTAILYSWPKGQPSQFNDPGAFLSA
jgi:cytochrome b6-f complex iron-sulfur subunit